MSPIHVSTESARPRLIAASKSAMETHKFSVLSFPGSKKKAYQQINAKERQYMNQEFVQHMVNMDFPNKKFQIRFGQIYPFWLMIPFLKLTKSCDPLQPRLLDRHLRFEAPALRWASSPPPCLGGTGEEALLGKVIYFTKLENNEMGKTNLKTKIYKDMYIYIYIKYW